MRIQGVLEHHRPAAGVLAAILCVAAVGCGSDDATPAAGAEVAATVGEATEAAPADAAETEAAASEGAETEGADMADLSDSGFGLGSATVTFGDEVHRFAISPERALELFGVLAVDLPLVESNGVAVDPGNGWLRMDIEIEDVADFEPAAEVRVAGGHWYAGASETASISGVETPEITLTGSGMSVTGTQMMAPIVAGPGEPIEATVEATCE
jgi:hypothetical protein